ncbi:hypothetical protein G647_02225 [Cladophialophora carrionii CBS 160.54]|uniref:Ammonium transporter AmtB-like domain-containing protein n=1 Tax=Cladophialophora carrionii CBS 160.54 TaxID=1279043 RepID=V9DHN5_9EURO|nr:uncharacterized protein G647_02225 [Cladophialophora carrionii CBS 160.54]ETI25452.1 hypothetical protein G647_02225 [Cladophialophora carrionii CBS 160.54]
MDVLGKQKWFPELSDDVVGDFHTHLVGDIVGGFLTGQVSSPPVKASPHLHLHRWVERLTGTVARSGLRLLAFCLSAAGIFSGPAAICLSIKCVLRIPLRYNEDQLLIGDGEVHGELAYAFSMMEDMTLTRIMANPAVTRRSEQECLTVLMLQGTSAAKIQVVVVLEVETAKRLSMHRHRA